MRGESFEVAVQWSTDAMRLMHPNFVPNVLQ